MTKYEPGHHPNSKKNLCKAGEPGKSPGRKHGSKNLKTLVRRFMDIEVPLKMPNGSVEQAPIVQTIIASLIGQAQKGNIRAAELLFNRGYGKEEQVIDVKNGQRLDELGAAYSERLSEAHDRIKEIIDARPGVDYTESTED